MYDVFLSLNNIEKFCMFHVNLSSIIFLLGWFFWDPCPGRSLFATKSTSVSEWCLDEWGTVHLYAPKSPWLHSKCAPFPHVCIWKMYISQSWVPMHFWSHILQVRRLWLTAGFDYDSYILHHSRQRSPKSFGYSRWCFYRCSSISSLLRDFANLRQQFSENSSGK
jgi:hypothetical protein